MLLIAGRICSVLWAIADVNKIAKIFFSITCVRETEIKITIN